MHLCTAGLTYITRGQIKYTDIKSPCRTGRIASKCHRSLVKRNSASEAIQSNFSCQLSSASVAWRRRGRPPPWLRGGGSWCASGCAGCRAPPTPIICEGSLLACDTSTNEFLMHAVLDTIFYRGQWKMVMRDTQIPDLRYMT